MKVARRAEHASSSARRRLVVLRRTGQKKHAAFRPLRGLRHEPLRPRGEPVVNHGSRKRKDLSTVKLLRDESDVTVKSMLYNKGASSPVGSHDDQEEGGHWPILGPFYTLHRGIESRLAADPDFLFKLVWELVQDQGICILTVVGTCGLPAFWTSQQFAHAALLHLTALLNDALIMYFLAPVARIPGQALEEAPHKIAHMFEPAEGVTISERLKCWVDKFMLYAPLGMLTGVMSCVMMQCCLGESLQMSHLLRVALVGLIHLGISANTRYQLINGADVLYYKHLDKNQARGCTILSRVVNQIAGGRLFLLLSALLM